MHHPHAFWLMMLGQGILVAAVVLRAPLWPPLLGGLLLAVLLGRREALSDREARRKRQRELLDDLSEGLHEGEAIVEGKLVFVRPQGDEGSYTVETRMPPDRDVSSFGAHRDLWWRLHDRLEYGVTSSPDEQMVATALDTPRGRVTLDGPAHVVLGDPDQDWCISAPRRLHEGMSVLARGRLVEESLPASDGSAFREAPMQLRLDPTVQRPGGQTVIPMFCVEPPQIRRNRLHMPLLLWLFFAITGLGLARFAEHRDATNARREYDAARREEARAKREQERTRRALENAIELETYERQLRDREKREQAKERIWREKEQRGE